MSTNAPARSYSVEGMTCGHCRMAVIEEISAVEGVESVEVDLESGRADVRGEVSAEQIRAAVEEAGYRLGEEA